MISVFNGAGGAGQVQRVQNGDKALAINDLINFTTLGQKAAIFFTSDRINGTDNQLREMDQAMSVFTKLNVMCSDQMPVEPNFFDIVGQCIGNEMVNLFSPDSNLGAIMARSVLGAILPMNSRQSSNVQMNGMMNDAAMNFTDLLLEINHNIGMCATLMALFTIKGSNADSLTIQGPMTMYTAPCAWLILCILRRQILGLQPFENLMNGTLENVLIQTKEVLCTWYNNIRTHSAQLSIRTNFQQVFGCPIQQIKSLIATLNSNNSVVETLARAGTIPQAFSKRLPDENIGMFAQLMQTDKMIGQGTQWGAQQGQMQGAQWGQQGQFVTQPAFGQQQAWGQNTFGQQQQPWGQNSFGGNAFGTGQNMFPQQQQQFGPVRNSFGGNNSWAPAAQGFGQPTQWGNNFGPSNTWNTAPMMPTSNSFGGNASFNGMGGGGGMRRANSMIRTRPM